MYNIVSKKEPEQLNKNAASSAGELRRAKKKVLAQAGLAVMTVLLTVVIVFGMTAAWYTNVVQSGGLIFQVEELGVNVNAVIGASNFRAKPGDTGVISLTADNQGTGLVNVTVSANKTSLSPEMQQRLYFYVEAQQTLNGETAQRTYLTDGSGYTYSVFAGDSLTLTGDYHNHAQLKWCWVYDVLGYYVLADVDKGNVNVREYLQPIEYDYDSATFHADGTLATVDGTMSAMEFLSRLSTMDGYQGILEKDVTPVAGYYPISVDANGYGVYAYLCTREQVEANTDYDTQLGREAAAGQVAEYQVRLTVNAEVPMVSPLSVSSGATLKTQLEKGTAYVKLGNSGIQLTETVSIPANTDVVLDLNGHALDTSGVSSAFTLNTGSSLTVINGDLISNQERVNAFTVYGAELSMSNVDLSGYYRAIMVADNNTNGLDSTVRLTGCTFNTAECALLVYGNGSDSAQDTRVIVENCTMTSADIVICGNGTSVGDAKWGTDIQIINSVITQLDSETDPLHAPAIYHPQMAGTLNIYNSTVTGHSGIAIKGGTVTVTKSTVVGTATEGFQPPKANNSGSSNTGDGIYVETGYGYNISLTLVDCEVSSYHKLAVRIYEENTQWVTYAHSGCTMKDYLNGKIEETVP